MADNDGSLEDVRRIAETCEKLVEDVVHGRCNMEEFGEGLRKTGITPEAGGDYVREVKVRLENQLRNNHSATGSSNTQSGPEDEGPAHSDTPAPAEQQDAVAGGSRGAAGAGNAPSSAEVDVEVAWALLRSKLGQMHSDPPFCSPGSHQMEGRLAELLKTYGSPDNTVPAPVLAVAPHLAKLSDADSLDEHLRKTWELRQDRKSTRLNSSHRR